MDVNSDADVDIAIVGAGAAGLAAGIFASETRPHLKIVLLDAARSIGAKILVSGGGRCNVTNVRVTSADFHAPARMVKKILPRFDEHATVRWFESLGVPLKEEPTGKLFPVSNKARTVLQALLRRGEELGLRTLTGNRVQAMTPDDGGFQIVHSAGKLFARQVIMATGGRSLPKTGSDGHGWTLAQGLGHTVTPTYPALVPLVLDGTFFHGGLSGISHEATLLTQIGGKLVDRRTGSLLWTHFGISGPVVLDASRFWVMGQGQELTPLLSMSFFPGKSFENVDRWLSSGSGQTGRRTLGAFLGEHLPNRVVKALCTYVSRLDHGESTTRSVDSAEGNVENVTLSRLPRLQRREVAKALTNLSLPVVEVRGWNHAEVTAGGVPLQEVNPHTMASRKVPGLYLIGEMLDCDGRIGGFNFQWAWTTGFIAGTSAAGSLSKN